MTKLSGEWELCQWLTGPRVKGDPDQRPLEGKLTSMSYLPTGTWASWTMGSLKVPCRSCD